VVEHQLRVLHRAHPPVADLVAGQVLEDQLLLLVVVDVSRLRGRSDEGRARRGQHDRGHRRSRDVLLGLHGRGLGTSLSCGGLPRPDPVPLVHLRPRPGRHILVQLLLGRRAALGFGGVRHDGVDGGRDRTRLVAAVGLLLLAAWAGLPGVEQHPVIAPHVAALLTLRQPEADQPAHRVLDRPGQPHLVSQTPGKPVGEDLRRIGAADEPNHPAQLTAGGGLHQATGGRTLQPRPH
jgi:hypothetical protein